MSKPAVNQQNPLIRYMRQPKIYVTLPSKGKYWPANAISIPENGELPIYSMTAKDELMFKTPDALLNGQSVIDVIQSCVPNIKNAWAIPSIDLDMILVAIRIATYGETMTVTYTVPVVNEEGDYEINLTTFIDHIGQNVWIEEIPLGGDMTIFVKPLTYKHMTNISQKSFETNKIMQIADNDSYTDSEKASMISTSFKTLTDLTTDMISGSIFQIQIGNEIVKDPKYIKEFIENADKGVTDVIQKHLNELKTNNELKPVRLQATPEQILAGAPESFEVPINFDQTNFFA
jgi:hypothetical protein